MAGSGSSKLVLHRPRGIVRVDVTLISDTAGVTTGVDAPDLFGPIVGVFVNGGAAGATPVYTLKDKRTGATLAVLTASGAAAAGYTKPGQLMGIGTSTFGTNVASSTSQTDAYKPIHAAGKITVSQTAGGNALTGILSIVVDEGAASGQGTVRSN